MLKRLNNFPFIIVFILLLVSNNATAQNSTSYRSYCRETYAYNNQAFRNIQYWQYVDPVAAQTDTFIVDETLDPSSGNTGRNRICRRIFLETNREAVYFQNGDITYLMSNQAYTQDPVLSSITDSACLQTIANPTIPSPQGIATVDTYVSAEANPPLLLIPPTDLLLAPNFIGTFPQPGTRVYPLNPYQGRGFYFSIPIEENSLGVTLVDDVLTNEDWNRVVQFYLDQMPGWNLLERGVNPEIVVGNYTMFLTLVSAENSDFTIDIRFDITRTGTGFELRIAATTPPTVSSNQVNPATIPITGSSFTEDAFGDIFTRWDVIISNFVEGELSDEGYQVYVLGLSDGASTYSRFIEILNPDANFQRIRDEVITQTLCDPNTFWPSWREPAWENPQP